jgi:predicted dienelactone hydrolase
VRVNHLASHGFIVIAANTPNPRSGEEMRAGVDWVLSENAREQSPLFDTVDEVKLGATGHSQGGGGSCAAATDARINVVASIQGATHCIGNPLQAEDTALLLTGSADTVVPSSEAVQAYELAAGPTVYALLEGASHFIPVGDGGAYRG